jgi:hypothetical protein
MRSTLMRQGQPAERLRQILGRRPIADAAGAGDEKIGTDLLRPEPDLDRLGDAAPDARVRGHDDLGRAAARQVGPDRVGAQRVVVDQQDAVALVAQPLYDDGFQTRFVSVMPWSEWVGLVVALAGLAVCFACFWALLRGRRTR